MKRIITYSYCIVAGVGGVCSDLFEAEASEAGEV